MHGCTVMHHRVILSTSDVMTYRPRMSISTSCLVEKPPLARAGLRDPGLAILFGVGRGRPHINPGDQDLYRATRRSTKFRAWARGTPRSSVCVWEGHDTRINLPWVITMRRMTLNVRLCVWGVWRQALEFQVKCLRFRLLLVFQNDFAGRATFTAAANPGRQRNASIALLVVENMDVGQKRSGR